MKIRSVEALVESLLEFSSMSVDQMIQKLDAIPEDIWGGNGLDVNEAAKWLFDHGVRNVQYNYESIAKTWEHKMGGGTGKDVLAILKRLDVLRAHAAGTGTDPEWGTLPGGQKVR